MSCREKFSETIKYESILNSDNNGSSVFPALSTMRVENELIARVRHYTCQNCQRRANNCMRKTKNLVANLKGSSLVFKVLSKYSHTGFNNGVEK